MDASVTTRKQGPDARAETLVSSYERAGYARVAPAMLQPAEPFLDLSGEDIRRRMYLTTAPDGDEFCLRPDLTIPVSRDYLASSARGKWPASAISVLFFVIAPMGPRNSCRLASSYSDAPTRRLRTPRCFRSAWRRRRTTASHHPTSRLEMSRCSPVSLQHSIFRPRGSDGSSRTSTANPIWRRTSIALCSAVTTLVPSIRACWLRLPAPIRKAPTR